MHNEEAEKKISNIRSQLSSLFNWKINCILKLIEKLHDFEYHIKKHKTFL